jgi:hypothetical protein
MIILGRNNKAHPLSKVNFSQFSCAMDDAIWLEIMYFVCRHILGCLLFAVISFVITYFSILPFSLVVLVK